MTDLQGQIDRLRETVKQIDGYAVLVAATADTAAESKIANTLIGITRPVLEETKS